MSNKNYLLPALGLLSVSLSVAKAEAAAKQQPNVIFILSDDQGYGDLACHGNKIIKTPNIDKLHAESVRFTEFHVGPTSAPSRSGLMTGRNANRVGVWHTIGGRSLLWEDETTLPQVMTANGYTCAIFGKWHLGDNYPSRPLDKGFQHEMIHGGGGVGQGPDYWGNDYFSDSYRTDGVWKPYEGYCTDVFFAEAMKFIEANKDKPFFCYLPVNAPHSPYNVPEKYYNIYKDETEILEHQKKFYGMITNLDDNYGRLNKKLKELKLDKNTIVIFMTDNGTAAGVKTIKGKTYGHTAGRRGTKAMPYDGGHRVPFFIKYPNGKIGGGVDINTLTSNYDFLPTMIDLLGLTKGLPTKEIEGKSLMPLIKDKNAPWEERTIITDSQRRQNIVKWHNSAVMTQRWRLVNRTELYDMDNDAMQTTNVAEKYPDVVTKLQADYEKWWKVLVDEGVNERYAYIKVGTKHENPVRISAHDMHTESTAAHAHVGVRNAANPLGIYKIQIAEEGRYKISLRRYPPESKLKFNSVVAEIPETIEVETKQPAAKQVNFVRAEINFGKYTMNRPVKMDAESYDYVLPMPEGKFNLDAFFVDDKGVKYPPYYVVIEKL